MISVVQVDVLEIALREQLDMVDKIFIVEATTTTKGVRQTKIGDLSSLMRIGFVDK